MVPSKPDSPDSDRSPDSTSVLRYVPGRTPAQRAAEREARTRPVPAVTEADLQRSLHRLLIGVLTPDVAGARRLSADDFAALQGPALDARADALIRVCRQGRSTAARAAENVVVLLWMLAQTLTGPIATSVRRLFFRFIPTLIHLAHRGFSDDPVRREDGFRALEKLQQVLVEISAATLTPSESAQVLSSVDQLAMFIEAGDYTVANHIVGAQLERFLERNALKRALYHLMQAEAEIERYIRDRLGRGEARIRLPHDVPLLGDYAPLRIFDEPRGGRVQRLLEVQLPNIQRPEDVVVRLMGAEVRTPFDRRLDALGALELMVPDDSYQLGLVYDPPRAC